MKKSISFYDFEQEFTNMNRSDNFSYDGKKALFDYLEEYEEDTGEEIELDIIALCCDYTEFENIDEFVKAYDDTYIVWETEPEEEGEENEATEGEVDYEGTLDKIREYTQVIDIDAESFIIQDF